MTIKDILDLGTTGILAVGVWALWTRLSSVTDRVFNMLEQGQAERQVIARQNGLSTQDLRAEAAKVRKRMEAEK